MTDLRVLEADGLEVRYGSTVAVRGLSVAVEPGEVVGLIGPDGAGKTSTLRVLGGLMRANAGEITAFGEDGWRHRRRLHHRLGYLAQRFALYGDLTVSENVQFFALMFGVKGWRERRRHLLDLVGLEPFADRLADQLSGGMKQKLALACTLIHAPDVLLLDEPTTGVDPVTRRELWRLLAELVREGLTLVVATPSLDEAERCTRVMLMHNGRVIADDRPRNIPDRVPGTMLEVSGPDRKSISAALEKDSRIKDITPFGVRLHVRLEGEPREAEDHVRTRLESASLKAEVRHIRPTLEDAFLYLTTDEPTFAEAV